MAKFRPGRSGNPGGRPKGALSAPAIIRRRWHEVDPDDEHGRTFFERAVDALKLKAAEGDAAAYRELYDRCYGKARQTITLTTEAREHVEREVDRIMEECAAAGEPVTRAEALAALAAHSPEAAQLVEAEGGDSVN